MLANVDLTSIIDAIAKAQSPAFRRGFSACSKSQGAPPEDGALRPSPYCNVALAPELEAQAANVQEEIRKEYEEAERALELMRQEGENEAEELSAE